MWNLCRLWMIFRIIRLSSAWAGTKLSRQGRVLASSGSFPTKRPIRTQFFALHLTTDASSVTYLNGTDTSYAWERDHSVEIDEDTETPLRDDSHDQGDDDQDSVDDPLQQEHADWLDAVHKAMVVLEKKQVSLKKEWDKAQNVEQTVARAQLIVSNLYRFPNSGVKSATVQDWENDGACIELALDPQYDSASEEADALFSQARKLKRGSKVVQELLETAQRAVETLRDAQLDLESALSSECVVEEGRLRLVQDRLKRTSKDTKFRIPDDRMSPTRRAPTPPSRPKKRLDNVRKIVSPAGCPILVGRNRRGNEYLSFQVARGKDIWMHSRGCPGAHVIVQHRRGGPTPTEECLQLAANLAAFYSDARTESKAAVSTAEPKHILKPRGAPLGAVKLREEFQVLTGRPNDVPGYLKAAREGSGLSDEYRAADKAKHRRRTQQVTKQSQEKKRAEQRSKRKRRSGGAYGQPHDEST